MKRRTMFASLLLACAPIGWWDYAAMRADGHELAGHDHDHDHDHEPAAYRTRGSGWSSTSSGTSGLGNPAVLTWSIVPDGTTLPRGLGEPASPSNLIAFMDSLFYDESEVVPGDDDLMQRQWFELFDSSYERWEQVAGITFTYEPNDDMATVSASSASRGVLGARGDHRIGGHNIDGDGRPSVLGYSYFPSYSDMVIDTSEATIFGNPEGNYIRLRNMLMHETGHGLGLNHVESDDVSAADGHQFGSFLMEPFLSTRFDGPQFDDILGAHRLYGDVYEKGAGNQTYQTATDLGVLGIFQSLTIGTDANDKFVDFTDVDFVSIDDNSDIDYFRFTIHQPTTVNLILTPMGPEYLEGAQGSATGNLQTMYDASALGDLNLTLYDVNGTTNLGASFTLGLGVGEQVLMTKLSKPGEYFVRVGSVTNDVQMFQLQVTSVPEPTGTALLAGVVVCGLALRRRWSTAANSSVYGFDRL